jgi:hypothetical protein
MLQQLDVLLDALLDKTPGAGLVQATVRLLARPFGGPQYNSPGSATC